MTREWIGVYSRLLRQPKFRGLSDAGQLTLLYTWLLASDQEPEATWPSRDGLTDLLEFYGRPPMSVEELFEARFLEVTEDGAIAVHDWDQWQYAASLAGRRTWERHYMREWRKKWKNEIAGRRKEEARKEEDKTREERTRVNNGSSRVNNSPTREDIVRTLSGQPPTVRLGVHPPADSPNGSISEIGGYAHVAPGDDPFDAPETPVLAWLAEHSCDIPPTSKYRQHLVTAVERHGAPALLEMLERLAAAGYRNGDIQGFIWGAIDNLDRQTRPTFEDVARREREEAEERAHRERVEATKRRIAELRGDSA